MQPQTSHLSVIDPDSKPQHKGYARPFTKILSDLSKPLPQRFLSQRKQGGQLLTYISWHNTNRLLDYFCPGWEGEVTKIHTTGDRIFVTYRLTIHAQEGKFSREASGTERLDCSSYGDPTSNAESMAFRRAAARFGLGLYLYKEQST